MKKKKVCSVQGCGRQACAKGLCRAHRYRQQLYGEVYADIPLGRSGAGLTPPKQRKLAAIPAGSRQCSVCKAIQPLTEFHKDKNGRQGQTSHCKACQRDRWLQCKYDITSQDYENLLKRQGNRCALCQTELPQNRNGHIDHNHKTGQIRGLLCRACNQHVIGIIEKRNISIARLRDYLNGAYALKR